MITCSGERTVKMCVDSGSGVVGSFLSVKIFRLTGLGVHWIQLEGGSPKYNLTLGLGIDV